ncbi:MULTISPECIES: PilW family protein [unclassified Pseudomonas]|uniref:PilW family protein n=1 Tax=unclassified Pseudomonas TaxID=196821 RepID=UPI00129E2691|nr:MULTISPECIES: PilW family protein [unclassified Pseudomonas]MDH4654331.1 prepilin-type N-terminal cleavage/methylation domain-containing protein [Pseudomonas sp. BN606]MRK23632.1 prepilin-type N-terminal cleavage/methylation domain-containing protein [Pseudomonas sp. JG-B]
MLSKILESGRQRGFSLVEMMIAMVLGLVILLAVSNIFLKDSRVRGEIEKTSRQIENGNYALRLLESEFENAGYWGEAGAQDIAGTPPPLCPTSKADIIVSLGYPVQGELVSGVSCADEKSGTDFIAIRRASTCAVGDDGCAAASSNYHLQVSACQTSSAGVVGLSTNVEELTATQRDCATLAPRYRFLSRVYYVSDADILMRAELSGGNYSAVTSLVDGIESIHYEYGLDDSGDGIIDEFKSNPSGVEWSDVIAVKVYLIARNSEPTAGFVDGNSYILGDVEYDVPDALKGYKRQLYSTTVNLRNVAGRRELP